MSMPNSHNIVIIEVEITMRIQTSRHIIFRYRTKPKSRKLPSVSIIFLWWFYLFLPFIEFLLFFCQNWYQWKIIFWSQNQPSSLRFTCRSGDLPMLALKGCVLPFYGEKLNNMMKQVILFPYNKHRY